MEILSDAKFWVACAFFLFVALVYRKISYFLGRALDDRSARIKRDLLEAQKLREEAEALLMQYKQRQAEYIQEAQQMLQKAQADADALIVKGGKDLQLAMEARTQQALDKIAQEEAKAVNDVRNHVVDIAMAAARAIIVDQVGNLPQDDLVKLALSDMERKIH